MSPIPNAFTIHPDGYNDIKDGFNDDFEIRMKPVQNYLLVIQDLYGNIVFETNDQYNYWNGKKFNTGEFVRAGKYTYTVIYSNEGRQEKSRGIVNVLK